MLQVPETINKRYNHALSVMQKGKGTLVGNQEKLGMLTDALLRLETPSAILLGEQGVGKTALVEQWLCEHPNWICISLNIEVLGALGTDLMVARISTLLSDMQNIRNAMFKDKDKSQKKMFLFIDEIHKLYRYGLSKGSSAAMNALKEGLARGKFPVIAATTDYEYRKMVTDDPAFDRRFSKIVMQPPTNDVVLLILKKRIIEWTKAEKYVPRVNEKILKEIIDLTNAYIRDQVNPAKSLAILEGAVAHETRIHLEKQKDTAITHDTLAYVFHSQGYNIDSPVTAKTVKQEIEKRIKGQPLAIRYISDNINSTFYTKRDRRKPMMTLFLVGSTGVGKTETAKAFAKAFFGTDNALLTLNGGDYGKASDAALAQHFIGDQMAVNKQKVILLDEIEKSNRQVLFGYMRMIDEGIVRDSNGIERSINNTIIIATSNLAGDIFQQLKENMQLDTQRNPDILTDKLLELWWQREADVRDSLTSSGDIGINNQIKPEFLERFQLLIPYLPLAKVTKAEIARMKLEQFIQEESELGYRFLLPERLTAKDWEILLSQSPYGNMDCVSVMIAEDVVNTNASTTGARAINRFIDNSLKPKAAQVIADLKEKGQPTNGNFYICTNGNATFESNSRMRSDVKVMYVPVTKINDRQYIQQILTKISDKEYVQQA